MLETLLAALVGKLGAAAVAEVAAYLRAQAHDTAVRDATRTQDALAAARACEQALAYLREHADDPQLYRLRLRDDAGDGARVLDTL